MIAAEEISLVVKGKIIQEGAPMHIEKLLFDSRKLIVPGASVFIPLITDRRNAHKYINEVYDAGVRCFVTSESINIDNVPNSWIIEVKDTLRAAQQIAAWHRAKFQIPVIGITGSNGKTILKEWLYQLLEKDLHVTRSPKSFNSQIGVPISVCLLNKDSQIAIFEAGISQPGEMEYLEKMIKPTIGIFTNIGEAHSEGFLNLRHKINEKLILFKNASVLIYNKDYPELHDCVLQFTNQLKNAQQEIKGITWSKKSVADLVITSLQKNTHHTQIHAKYLGETVSIEIPFTDNASIENAIHCWLLLLHMQIQHDVIAERMQKLTTVAMRLEMIKGIHHCTIINDSYNSDVSSLGIALDFLAQQQQHDKKTVILSDILQSGREHELYEEVAELLIQKNIQRFIGIGESLSRNKEIFLKNKNIESSFYKSTDDFLHAANISSFQQECILIKGARKFTFEKIAKRLQERTHQTQLEIDLYALSHNYKQYQTLLKKGTKIMAMVKAFSYGSGSFEVANKLQFEGVDYLAVAYTDEGIHLRKNGINLPILVMNPDENSYDQIIEWKLEPEIYNIRTLEKFIETSIQLDVHSYPIHIKLDTGMHRLGFEQNDLDNFCMLLQKHNEVKVVSVFTHLAGSEDVLLDNFTNTQASIFDKMCNKIKDALGFSFIKHVCNSSAIIRHPHLHYDMVRLGLGLYGVDSTHIISDKLKTVSKFKTGIAQIKNIKAGDTIGYNRKGLAEKDMVIGTVCVGYADGLPRSLSNGKGFMILHGNKVPIIGNVCMDMCMLDITLCTEAKEGDKVEIFGDEMTIEELAKYANTIPYEILTSVSQRVKRVYYDE